MKRTLSHPWRAVGVIAALGASGCVSEAERSDASRLRRPAMPKMRGEPAGLAAAPEESEVLRSVRSAAASGDYSMARRRLEADGDRALRERVARAVADGLAESDPLTALAWARALAPGLAQAGAAEVAARARVRRDPESAVKWAVEFGEPELAPVVRRAAAAELVAIDPAQAVRRTLALGAGAEGEEFLGLVAAEWTRRDPDAAERWVREHSDGARRVRLLASVGFELAQTQPVRAIALVESLPPGRDRWLLVTAITQTWVAVDARAAFAWTGQLPTGETREAAVAGLDAGLGVAVARRMVAAPETRSGTGRRAGGAAWDESSPWAGTAFAAWLASQPAGLGGDDAILAYVRQRGAIEPHVVGQWLETLAGSSVRERAMEVFWETLLGVSPAEAARWLQAQPRSERTPERVERTAREWLRTNPDAAAAWLRGLPLPPERIEWLLREAGRE